MAEIARKTKRYPTDLTDEEREGVHPFLPEPAKRGRKPKTDLRELMNAIRYLARSGVGWDMLPRDFPPSGTVYWWFRRFVRRTLMDKAAYKDFVIEIIRRIAGQKGFEVLPRRRVVERTFGWMTCWRRWVRDYAQRIDVSKAMIHVAMGSRLWPTHRSLRPSQTDSEARCRSPMGAVI